MPQEEAEATSQIQEEEHPGRGGTGHRGSSRSRRASGDPAGSGEIPLDMGTMK